MIRIEAAPQLQTLSKAFRELEKKQLPFAMALAATNTAERVRLAERAALRQDIDNPTKTTINSLFKSSATKRNPEARVWFKDNFNSGIPADRYMQPQVNGGGRPHKRFEKALIARGLMKSGQYAIPRPAVLDSNGNVKGGQVMRILSGLGAAETVAGYQANASESRRSRKKNNKRFFVAKINNAEGVWERIATGFGSGVKLWFLFVDKEPKYKQRLDFFGIAEREVAKYYEREFTSALEFAIATAKR